jgi:uncharacterized protein involved in outer membrane biogenesis
VAEGTYNDVPAKLQARTGSLSDFRNASAPFGVVGSLSNASTASQFEGILMDPLNFDGVHGEFALKTQRLADALRIVGHDSPATVPAAVRGTFERAGNQWRLSQANGELGGSAFEGTLVLAEGGRRRPDELSLDLAFADLNLDPILDGFSGKPTSYLSRFLQLEVNPDPRVAAVIRARQVGHRALRVGDVALRGRILPGRAELQDLSLQLFGGKLNALATAQTMEGRTRFNGETTLSGADAAQLASLTRIAAGQVSGRIDGGLAASATGTTMTEMVKASRAQLLFVMTRGQVSRGLIERASVDLRTLFRQPEGVTRVTCLLGLVDIEGGSGRIGPLRLRTHEGTVNGAGRVDLLSNRLDLTLASDPSSTGFLALDVPIRVSGNIDRLQVSPFTSQRGELDLALDNQRLRALSPTLRPLVEHSSCRH